MSWKLAAPLLATLAKAVLATHKSEEQEQCQWQLGSENEVTNEKLFSDLEGCHVKSIFPVIQLASKP